MHGRIRTYGAPLALAALLASGPAFAADDSRTVDPKVGTRTTVITTTETRTPVAAATVGAANETEMADARETVRGATAAITAMKGDPALAGLLQRAKGILIVPEFTKGALIIGGWGGEAVLLGRQGTNWVGPAFYDVAAVSAGAEIGFTSGTLAVLLMSDSAVNAFRTDETVSLNANAELTVIDYSAKAQGSVSSSDIIVWSDTEGAFIGAGGSLSDVDWDGEANNAYYRQNVTARQILDGQVKSDSAVLINALPG